MPRFIVPVTMHFFGSVEAKIFVDAESAEDAVEFVESLEDSRAYSFYRTLEDAGAECDEDWCSVSVDDYSSISVDFGDIEEI